MKKHIFRRLLSMIMAVAMVVTMIPSTVIQAEQQEEVLKNQLRNSVSDEEYPNGLLGFGKTQISVTEGGQETITVVRQGNTDNEATVHFKAVDISAKYASDYNLTVHYSDLKKKQLLENPESTPLIEQQAEVTTGEMSETVVSSVQEAEEKQENSVEKSVESEEQKDGTKSGLSAAYQIQNEEEAPQNDWKEYNPQNATEEVTSSMANGNEATQDYIMQMAGVEAVLTFKPGEYRKEIVLDTIDDDKSESEEQIAFFLYDAQGAEIGADYNGYVNIKDNEESVDNVFAVKCKEVVVEKDQNVAQVTIVRKSGIDQMAFVQVGTKSNTAIANVDYESVAQQLIFPAGVEEKTIEIPIIGDRTEEKNFWVGINKDGVVCEDGNSATLVTLLAEETDEIQNTSSQAETSSDAVAMDVTGSTSPTISKTDWVKNGGSYVTSSFDYRFASKIKVEFTVTGQTNQYDDCDDVIGHYYDKRVSVVLTKGYGGSKDDIDVKTADFGGSEQNTGSVEFTHDLTNKSGFTKWDCLNKGLIWVNVQGLNGNSNSNVSVKVTKVTVYYPEYTIQINNGTSYSVYTPKEYSGEDSVTDAKNALRLGEGYFGNDAATKSVVISNETKLDISHSFKTSDTSAIQTNTQGVSVSSNTVKLEGFAFKKSSSSAISKVYSLDWFKKNNITKAFLSEHFSYMSTASKTFELVPVYTVKDAEIEFDNSASKANVQIGKNCKGEPVYSMKDNVKGKFTGYTAGTTLKVKKLDTFVVNAAVNSGYALKSITVSSKSYSTSNAYTSNTTSLAFGLGNNVDTKYKVSTSYEDASVKVKPDPLDKNTDSIKKGTVVYVDENKKVYSGDYNSDLVIKDISMNKTYNIIAVAEEGYRAVWRDGTLDYDEDGKAIPESDPLSKYKSFTSVKGSTLPYVTQTAVGRVYYSFEKRQESGDPADILGYVTIKDKMLLTGEEITNGINGANVTADGIQVQTTTGAPTAKGIKREGFFRIESDNFSKNDYYLVNVNAYGEEGSINTGFVMNPEMVAECVIDTAKDLAISNVAAYVKDAAGNYQPKTITVNKYTGYFTGFTNGNKDYRITMTAEKSGLYMKSAKLQFYDKDGNSLNKSVDGKAINNTNDGQFRFDFNPEKLELPIGTTLRVTFTDNQNHTYLQREVGISLSQSFGKLDVANSFTFGGANTVVKIIGTVDSIFDMGWNGDFDDEFSDYITVDPDTGDKTICVGINKELVDKQSKRTPIQRAAESLAKKEQAVADANKAVYDQEKAIKKLEKKSKLTESEKKELAKKKEKLTDLQKDVKKANTEKQEERKKFDDKVEKAQDPKKVQTTISSNVSLDFGFSFMMTFGYDAEESKYYFKSMMITATVEGGGSVSAAFATPIGITINLGFAAGGEGTAMFIIEERKDLVSPKKYYITDLTKDGELDVFDCDLDNHNRKYDGSGSFNLKPYIQLSVGAGVLGNTISVSISGKATFDMNFYTSDKENTGMVNLSSELSVKVLFISHSWTLVSEDINLFGNAGAESLFEDENYLYDTSELLEPVDISYMEGGSNWKDGLISAKSIDETEGAYVETSLADKIGENPNFKMISIGDGKYLAVFVNVDPERDAVNAGAAYYTLYNPQEGWSTPVMIEDDGTLDQDVNVFDLGTHGAVITWSSAGKVFTSETSRVDMQNSLDLHGVFFDKTKGTLGNIMNITKQTTDEAAGTLYDNYSDYCADVSANVSYNDGKMIVYYQKKEYASEGDNEYIGDVLFPQYALMAARTYTFDDQNSTAGQWTDSYSDKELVNLKDGFIADGLSETVAQERADAYNECFYGQRMFSFLPSVSIDEKLDEQGYWTEEPTVNEIDGTSALVIDSDAMSYNDLGVFVYTIDYDGDLKTVNDRDVYMQIYDFVSDSFIHPVVITSDAVSDGNVQFVRVVNRTYLTWLHEGNIVALDTSRIVGNYENMLKSGKTSSGDEYYYLDKTKPTDETGADAYLPPMTIVEGEVGDADNAVSAISSFDVQASDSYVYFMWTQSDGTFVDGVEEGSEAASDPANAITETQMYTARYDVANRMATKPVQVTSVNGANYSDVAFAVEGDMLRGLVYRADSKLLSLEEYNAMIEKNNESAQASNGDKVDANEEVEPLVETGYVPFSVVDKENAVPYAFVVDPKSVVKIKNAQINGAVAGSESSVAFEILNDGIDTVEGLKVKASDKDGKSILYSESGDSLESVALESLYGGYNEAYVGYISVPEDATSVDATIIVEDKDGNVIAQETITETLESTISIYDMEVTQTSERNRYLVTGTIENTGTAKAAASEVEIGSTKDNVDKAYVKAAYPDLAPGEIYEFEQTITVSPNTEFITTTDEDGAVTETGTIYVSQGDVRVEDSVVRSADSLQMKKMNAIKDVALSNLYDGKVIVPNGNNVLMQPVISSELAGKTLTGEEGLQYAYVIEDENIATVDDNGFVSGKTIGETKLTLYAYPKDYVFVAENQTADYSASSVLGQYEDVFVSLPETAIYSKTFNLSVVDPYSIIESQNQNQNQNQDQGQNQNPPGNTDTPTEPVKDTTVKSFTYKGAKYKVVSSKEVAFTGVTNKKATKIVIPDTVKKNGKTYKVTSIVANACSGMSKVKTISIGKNVKTIGKKAFYGCKKVTKITIPANVTKIQTSAFEKCSSLKKVTIKTKKVKAIGKSAFKGIHKKAVFTLTGTKKQKKAVKKLLSSKTGYKKNMKIK